MKVLICEPGKYAHPAEIGEDITDLQKIVGGYIEATYPWQDHAAIVCNDSGLIEHLPLCRMIDKQTAIAGTFFICGLSESSFTSLTNAQLEHYMEMFQKPEFFFLLNDNLCSIKCTPKRYVELMGPPAPHHTPAKHKSHDKER